MSIASSPLAIFQIIPFEKIGLKICAVSELLINDYLYPLLMSTTVNSEIIDFLTCCVNKV